MNFEILYTYSIYEEHIMASLTGKHTKGKEMMDYNYEMHRNLYSNKPTFNSTILLAIGHKMHNTKLSQVPTSSSSIEGIFIASQAPDTNLETEPKIIAALD